MINGNNMQTATWEKRATHKEHWNDYSLDIGQKFCTKDNSYPHTNYVIFMLQTTKTREKTFILCFKVAKRKNKISPKHQYLTKPRQNHRLSNPIYRPNCNFLAKQFSVQVSVSFLELKMVRKYWFKISS